MHPCHVLCGILVSRSPRSSAWASAGVGAGNAASVACAMWGPSAWPRRNKCAHVPFERVKLYSPPARWGLLDFMSVAFRLLLLVLLVLRLLLLLLVLLVVLVILAVLVVWLSSSNCDPRSTVFSAGPQPRPSTPSVPCRTSTTTIPAQCSLPDLNHDHPRPVFPAGPQPRVSPPSVPCRTWTTTIHAQCSLPDLNREYPRPVFPAGPEPRPSTPSVPCRTSTASIHAKRYAT